jgi:hypothetical protein
MKPILLIKDQDSNLLFRGDSIMSPYLTESELEEIKKIIETTIQFYRDNQYNDSYIEYLNHKVQQVENQRFNSDKNKKRK